MTQAEFDGLPGLLTRWDFLQATGLNEKALRVMVASGCVQVFYVAKACGIKMKCDKGKYYKWQAAQIGGWRFEGVTDVRAGLTVVETNRLARIEEMLAGLVNGLGRGRARRGNRSRNRERETRL